MSKYQLAQVNIGRVRAPLEDPRMAGFVNRLEDLNALVPKEDHPGVVLEGFYPVEGAVARTVVDDDHLLDAVLEKNAADDPADGGFLVIGRNDDTKRR